MVSDAEHKIETARSSRWLEQAGKSEKAKGMSTAHTLGSTLYFPPHNMVDEPCIPFAHLLLRTGPSTIVDSDPSLEPLTYLILHIAYTHPASLPPFRLSAPFRPLLFLIPWRDPRRDYHLIGSRVKRAGEGTLTLPDQLMTSVTTPSSRAVVVPVASEGSETCGIGVEDGSGAVEGISTSDDDEAEVGTVERGDMKRIEMEWGKGTGGEGTGGDVETEASGRR